MKSNLSIFFLFNIYTFLFSQFNYSGLISPGNMYRLSDKSEISLPFRITKGEIGYSIGDFEFKINSALEYRWLNNETKFQFREAYILWYPSWGELKVGKQIHAWGSVDSNNPTDNLNPYDYYYMFFSGSERKVGNLFGLLKYYGETFQIEGIFVPKHKENRFPYGEESFPIKIDDPEEFLLEKGSEREFGFRVQSTLGSSDFSISYFRGRDRSFSYAGTIEDSLGVTPRFLYRKTNVVGLDWVLFIGDITNRFEFGIFSTKNDVDESIITNKDLFDASYIQYAAQLEYATQNNIFLSLQIIGGSLLEINGIISEDEFQPGMGTPFASFTDLGLALSVSANYFDNSLELMGSSFIDLEDSQSMQGLSFKYTPFDNWKLNFSISKFLGDKGTQFHNMEDFSHFKFGLEYHF